MTKCKSSLDCASAIYWFAWICLEVSVAQYAPVQQTAITECNGFNKGYLVEKFFNLVFTEFQTTPPVCVCAQMCPDQPTYCYPNGCMRPMEHKRFADEGGTHVSKQTTKEGINPSLHVLDGNNDGYANDDGYAQMVSISSDGGKAKGHIITGLPDILKDRVKILFKYKKLPKVEMRYNLKEQVKHMNMDKQRIDLNFIRKYIMSGDNLPVASFRSKAVKPRYSSDLNFKKTESSPITAFLLHDIRRNSFSKRDLKKNLEELENLKAAVYLKQSIVGTDDTPVLVYSVIDDLMNATVLNEIIDKEGIITLEDQREFIGENSNGNESAEKVAKLGKIIHGKMHSKLAKKY